MRRLEQIQTKKQKTSIKWSLMSNKRRTNLLEAQAKQINKSPSFSSLILFCFGVSTQQSLITMKQRFLIDFVAAQALRNSMNWKKNKYYSTRSSGSSSGSLHSFSYSQLISSSISAFLLAFLVCFSLQNVLLGGCTLAIVFIIISLLFTHSLIDWLYSSF